MGRNPPCGGWVVRVFKTTGSLCSCALYLCALGFGGLVFGATGFPAKSGGGAEKFFPALPDLAVAGPVVKLRLVERVQYVRVELALQLLGESLVTMSDLCGHSPGFLQRLAMPDNGRKRGVELCDHSINTIL